MLFSTSQVPLDLLNLQESSIHSMKERSDIARRLWAAFLHRINSFPMPDASHKILIFRFQEVQIVFFPGNLWFRRVLSMIAFSRNRK
jgi:hypothetical protein